MRYDHPHSRPIHAKHGAGDAPPKIVFGEILPCDDVPQRLQQIYKIALASYDEVMGCEGKETSHE